MSCTIDKPSEMECDDVAQSATEEKPDEEWLIPQIVWNQCWSNESNKKPQQ